MYESCEPSTGGISDRAIMKRKVDPTTHQEAGETKVEPGQACLPERTPDCGGRE
jgi:hypothetical protein